MGKRKFLIYASMAVIVCVAYAIYHIYGKGMPVTYSYSPESNYPVVSSAASFNKTFTDVKEMYNEADLVAKVEVVNHRFEQWENTGMVSTYSDIKIKKIYKGDQSLKTARVGEMGGLIDTGKVKLPQKDGVPANSESNQGMVESTLEGSPTMRAGGEYIVFLTKYPGQDLYNIVGSVQGKIKVDNKKNQLVTTVKEERIKKDDLFFLQKKYVGSKIEDLESDISSSK